MIGNDLGRSFEFVKTPTLAGQQAKLLPFSLPIIIAIYLLCAILSVLVSEILSSVMPEILPNAAPPADATAMEQQIYDAMQTYFAFFRSNPLIITLATAALSVVSSVLLFVVGRNFAPSTDFLESQSALARMEVVWTFFTLIIQGIAILFWTISSTAGEGFSNIIAIIGVVLFILKLHVVKGIFGFESFGKAALVWFLMMLCVVGVGFFLSLIWTVISL